MICLVIPPSPFLLDERVFMSLGVLKVAAALERAEYPVEVLDLSGMGEYHYALRAQLEHSRASVYGITATSPQLPAAARIADAIRATGRKVILGGPHATLVEAACKRDERRGRHHGRAYRAMAALQRTFDVIVAGDGERAIFAALGMAGDLEAPSGAVIDADDRHSRYWLGDEDLDVAPLPARHLLDVKSYRYEIEGAPALSLIAQLGCPFGCRFCAGRHSPMLRHIRSRGAASVVDEMTSIYERYGVTGFMFYDDELNVSRGMVELMAAIAQRQRMLGVEWRLRGFVKAELFTDAQAAAMRQAGFRWILVGFESGSERILENIHKQASRADNSRCIAIARANGLKVKALMSLGHPGESLETIRETRNWLHDVAPDDFDLTVITPYPGSPYYDDAERNGEHWTYTCPNGDRLHQHEVDYLAAADYYKGRPGDYVSHVWTDHLSSGSLVVLRDGLEAELRDVLGVPLNVSVAAKAYEHSMGQTGTAQ